MYLFDYQSFSLTRVRGLFCWQSNRYDLCTKYWYRTLLSKKRL